MSPQLIQAIQAKILAFSLFAASACGTLALFSSVPLIARLTTPHSQVALRQQPVSSQSSEITPAKPTVKAVSQPARPVKRDRLSNAQKP